MVGMHIANTLKTAVAYAFFGAVAVTATVPSAHAQPQYDSKLAKFLADRAASQLGALRDGFAMSDVPALAETGQFPDGADIAPFDARQTGAVERELPPLPRTDVRIVYAG
jgi:hypothetical protein